jgi:rubrerythrin
MANGPKSEKNLADAFAGESQANRKYLAFAKQADTEGYPQVARLFRAAAEAETVHAHAHLKALGGIKSTKENLQEAIGGETHEYKEMYPPMIEDAKAEGATEALRSFSYANTVEKTHAELYQKAADSLGLSGDQFDYYVCPVCGHTHEKAAPEKCPVCGVAASLFIQIK